MRQVLTAAMAALALSASAASAQDYASASQANSWSLSGEEKARFEGRVVDVLCELSGDCPENCGGGERQLGVLRKDDGALILAVKNGQPVFSGAVADLLPYCGAEVEVDGLFAAFDGAPAKLYQIQLIRRVGEAKFAKTNLFTKKWAERFPEAAKQKGDWFRKDPRVVSRIEKRGYLGLGLETDADFIKEEFGQ